MMADWWDMMRVDLKVGEMVGKKVGKMVGRMADWTVD